MLAEWLAEEAALDPVTREAVYWVALLRYIGCTGHAHEVATVFGDEIPIRAQSLVHDAANPAEVVHDVVAFATVGREPQEREQIAQTLTAGLHDWAVANFAAGCEVADMLVARLGFAPAVREALRFTFERWNGNGFPAGASGDGIPLAMRVVHISHDMEAIARHSSPERALEALGQRRGQTYDPVLADIFADHGPQFFERLAKIEPWDAVIALEPMPARVLTGTDLDDALTVVADFVDLKSPYMAGHSRRCAELVEQAARLRGYPAETVAAVRRAALVHELGTTAIPNSIWDKTGPLTRAEFDRVELHPMLTEQLLRRSPALARLNPVAATHHERDDGSGYHRRLSMGQLEPASGLLAAAEVYVGLTADRADRPAQTPASAGAELRRLVETGSLDRDSTDAVLAAAGQRGLGERRPSRPGGLTAREVEVLRLAARGLTISQIAEALVIAPKTADHHVQHIYVKIGVSSRAAAALWAIEHGVVNSASPV
jgi:HD-GYP domain-containing protein (c-di-GMP phosphodiesterase class II)